MQDTVIFLLLPCCLALLLLASRLRHASLTYKAAAYARLAAVKSSTVLKKLIPKLGQPEVYVSDRFAAHRLLVGGAATGGAFSDKPPSSVASAVLSRHRHYNINSAPYGSLWRAMRRNLTAEIFHPSRLRLFAPARRRALADLVADLDRQCSSGGVVRAAESIRAAMFGLMSTMCFGGDVDGELVKAMADAQDDLVQCFLGLRILSTFPAITGLIYRNRWRKLVELRRQQEEMYLPLIAARRRHDGEPPAYVDTLVDLSVPDEHGDRRRNKRRRRRQRKLTDGELVGLCSEFLGAGTEPAAAALQWIMANLVKRPDVQRALWKEIDAAVAAEEDEVGEEVLGRLDYLNAVIMEGLRLNPTVPVAFRQTAWADPLEFRPERFMPGGEGAGVSLVAAAGSAGEIRMMPFGAGRRMCPGMGIAMLHLGYFVANLVREFEWVEVEGDHAVDLRPHVGFFRVMKRPLHVRLVRRR
nr:unnamed protein product [Digitaria exilis]